MHCGDAVTDYTHPVKSGYIFSTWSYSPVLGEGNTMPDGNVTATAVWTIREDYTITFLNGYDGGLVEEKTNQVFDEYVETPDNYPKRAGYAFSGWLLTENGDSLDMSEEKVRDESNQTYYALWRKVYTVAFNANGHGTAPKAQTVDENRFASRPVDPTADGYTFENWYTDKECTDQWNFKKTPATENITLYAKWTEKAPDTPDEPNDIFNMGEETYSFRNYGDEDSEGGHCFGMAVTSSGYYTGALDKSIIGYDNSVLTYSLPDSAKVRKPICHYLHIQGPRGEYESMVAGGSMDLKETEDISSDWNECVDYVKNHERDGNGDLNIGMWFKDGGGHAVNFLYYENVDGQDRIFAYDNNYPNNEIYYYMGSDGYVHQGPTDTYGAIRGMDLMDVNKYFTVADEFNPDKYIYADKEEVFVKDAIIKDAIIYYMKCDAEYSDYVMYKIPDDFREVTIIPLVDNASFNYCDETYSFGEINEETTATLILPDSEGKADEAIFIIQNAPTQSEEPEKVPVVKLTGGNEKLSVDYRSTVTFHATVENGNPDNIVWYKDGEPTGVTGPEYREENVTSSFRLEAKYTEDGKTVQSDEKEVDVNAGFFAKVIAFFRSLFDTLPEYKDGEKLKGSKKSILC